MKYGVLIGALFATAFLATGAQAQTAGLITNSPHDLSSGSSTNADKNEICVYCHTPHGGAGVAVQAPLWNKILPAAADFTLYDSSTIDGEILAAGPGGVSLACLSCHDGSQATDVVINKPGTNGYDAGGSELDPTAGPLLTGVFAVGDSGDLANDHPIAVVYGGFGATPVDPDFNTTDLATIGADKWYLDLDGDAVRDKTDIILYTRAATGGDKPFVECGSCHDPHSGNTDDVAGSGTNAAGSGVSFMRVANTGSDLCLACHVK